MTMPKFEPVAHVDEDDNNKWATLVDDLDIKLNAPLYTADQLTEAYEAGKRDAPREAIGRILTEVMDAAVSNGADSRSMPDDYVAVAAWLCDIKPQSAPNGEE